LQQSHHRGIETRVSEGGRENLRCSNRTIVGLKQICGDKKFPVDPAGSNRTIVGLKPSIAGATALIIVSQQSHHCGIETFQFEHYPAMLGRAAIAPLWD